MDPIFEIDLALAGKGARQASRTLVRELKAAILDGRLVPGTRLPATRQAGSIFRMSRNTVAEAYERLAIEGLVATRRGSGTFVADRSSQGAPARARKKAAKTRKSDVPRMNEFWLRPDVTAAMGFWQDAPVRETSRNGKAASPPIVDFRPALIDSRLFPHDVFRQVTVRKLRGLERKPPGFRSAQGNQGSYPLREAVARHIALTRAIACHPDELVVTSGAQQAFDLLARVLVRPGETSVAIEDPGYPPMRVAFAAAGARLLPVPVDAEGICVDRIAADARVICVCPSHQFPLGVTMSARRRRELVDYARQKGCVIIEDDYDGEFRYEGSPLEALRATSDGDVVFYVGTFSKCMLPSLRLGFVIAPEWSLRNLIAAKNCLDWHCSVPVQLAVADFIAGGHLARHVRKMRAIYAKRRERLLAGLRGELQRWFEPIASLYGMHVAAAAQPALDVEALARRAGLSGVHVHSLRRYFLGKETLGGLVFGFGAVDPAQIEEGLARIRKAIVR
jgi:GntR family transcriptional regulator/MocR family aminotransferase